MTHIDSSTLKKLESKIDKNTIEINRIETNIEIFSNEATKEHSARKKCHGNCKQIAKK